VRVKVLGIAEFVAGKVIEVNFGVVGDENLYAGRRTEFERVGAVMIVGIGSEQAAGELQPAFGRVYETGPTQLIGSVGRVGVIEIVKLNEPGQVGYDFVMRRKVEAKLIGEVVVSRAQAHRDSETQQEQ
jgi:hypothetical protein